MSTNIESIRNLVSESKYQQAYETLKAFDCDPSTDEQKAYFVFLGLSAFETGRLNEAKEAYFSLLELLTSTDTAEQILEKSHAYYELSLTYFKMYERESDKENLDFSIKYCEQAIKMCLGKLTVEKTSGVMTYHKESIEPYFQYFIQLAVLYQNSEKNDKAIKMLNAIKAYCIHNCDAKYLGVIYDELGHSYDLLGNPQLALCYYSKALAIKTRLGMEQSADFSYRNIARCLQLNPGIMDERTNHLMGVYGGQSI